MLELLFHHIHSICDFRGCWSMNKSTNCISFISKNISFEKEIDLSENVDLILTYADVFELVRTIELQYRQALRHHGREQTPLRVFSSQVLPIYA